MNKILNILLICLAFSCKKDQQDEELHLQKTPYFGDELRIDGFYFREIVQNNSTQVFFLYQNGIILGGNVYTGDDWEKKLQESIASNLYNEVSKSYKSRWGLYSIKDSTIIFEKWYPASPGPRVTIAREGTILNDTTFHLQRSFRFENGKRVNIRERDELFHFRQFNPKPDSINPFLP